MQFTCLGTSSIGNCYLVKTDGSSILLDAGIPIQKIIKATNLNDLSFAFVSHKHKDHSLSLEKLASRGVQVIYGGLNQEWVKNRIKKKFSGNFYTFGVEHGDTLCNACIIETEEDTILYATDFNLCKWDLSMFQFTSLIVECNFIDKNVTQAMIDADPKIKRQINTHLGLDGLMIFLSHLDLTKCREIILVHQSTDPRLFNEEIVKTKVYSTYFIPTGICQIKGGIEWIGQKEEFEIE